MNRPWMKFYVADWRDARLRSCSLSARGLWIDLISYMHEAEPYGYLFIGGKIPTANEIALHLSRPASEVKRALTELEQFGVCSRSDNGAIFSRRMVRDKAKEIQDRENGKGGGNPQLTGGVNGHGNGGVNPEDKAQKLEARNQSPERKRKNKIPLPEDFAADRDFARKLGWPEQRIDQQIRAFFDSAKAHSRVYADWQAAWRNWCTSPFQKNPEGGKTKWQYGIEGIL